ncbi:nitroreductase family protein [Burkholderia gladioli]|uniref:nitroreductase family protein n=1 Tax=Burkholderia gladioli TaxID=28095 RepID=UPI00164114FB|nr:nitroreductase family protein [Burkholderia gladioli]
MSNLTEDPSPLGDGRFEAYKWPVVLTVPFEHHQLPAERSFLDVFESRRSMRALQPAPLAVILDALRLALVPRFWKTGDPLLRSRRPSLSAGALHPISILIFADDKTYRVNVEDSTLDELHVSEEASECFLHKCRQVLPSADGAFLILVADKARPNAAYDHPDSLIWRDAGALLQTLALAAESYELGFCPLGTLGGEVVSALPSADQLMAVGVATIGLRA